jgi:hypothetical protein
LIPVITRMGLKRRLSLLVAIALSLSVRAQVWELGAQLGGAGYMGDLNPTNPVKLSGLSGAAFVKANFDPYWSLGLHFAMGKIKANDASSTHAQFRQRNLSFHNTMKEVSLQLDFNFFDYFAGGGFSRISPYMYTGVGVLLFNPKTMYNGKEYELPLYTTEGSEYKKYALTVPFGAGIKYNVSGGLTLLGNVGYRNSYTDYLDDVSQTYPGVTNFDTNTDYGRTQAFLSDRSGEQSGVYIGQSGLQRGDFRKRDSYMFVGIGITYTFVSQKCY